MPSSKIIVYGDHVEITKLISSVHKELAPRIQRPLGTLSLKFEQSVVLS